MLGVNGYPCNKGLVVKMNGANTDSASMALGISLSHPLLCNLLGGSKLADDTYAKNTFEMMLTRSVHNNDLKGLGTLRNTEFTLSELNLAMNLNRLDGSRDHINFITAYNLGKESIGDKELIF